MGAAGHFAQRNKVRKRGTLVLWMKESFTRRGDRSTGGALPYGGLAIRCPLATAWGNATSRPTVPPLCRPARRGRGRGRAYAAARRREAGVATVSSHRAPKG